MTKFGAVFQISGGIGNQILGISAAHVASSLTGIQSVVDTSRYDSSAGMSAEINSHLQRNFRMDGLILPKFKGRETIAFKSLPFRETKFGERKIRQLMGKSQGNFFKEYWAFNHEYSEQILYAGPEKIVRGNFLNFQYLSRAIKEFEWKQLESLDSSKSRNFMNLVHEFDGREIIALHVRGGDMLKTHPTRMPKDEYWISAAQYFRSIYRNVLFLSFTDDHIEESRVIDLMYKNQFDVIRSSAFKGNIEMSDLDTLEAITMCDGLISSFSSFSGTAGLFMAANSKFVTFPESLLKTYRSDVWSPHIIVIQSSIFLSLDK